jgi:hypothetical protein
VTLSSVRCNKQIHATGDPVVPHETLDQGMTAHHD